VIGLSTLPGSDRLHGNHDVGRSVADHSLDDAGEVCPGAAEIVQQVVEFSLLGGGQKNRLQEASSMPNQDAV
jgi:hypothetical protein